MYLCSKKEQHNENRKRNYSTVFVTEGELVFQFEHRTRRYYASTSYLKRHNLEEKKKVSKNCRLVKSQLFSERKLNRVSVTGNTGFLFTD